MGDEGNLVKYIIILLLFVIGCGETSPVNDMPEPDSLDSQAPQPVLSCYQQSNSPSYPDGVNHYIPFGEPEPLTNRQMQLCATVYDKALFRGNLTEDEYDCLIDDISTLRIVFGNGTKNGNAMGCGENGCARAGCINDFVFVMLFGSSDDAIRHKCCHRAKHMIDGDRGHDDPEWWIAGINDCRFEEVLR